MANFAPIDYGPQVAFDSGPMKEAQASTQQLFDRQKMYADKNKEQMQGLLNTSASTAAQSYAHDQIATATVDAAKSRADTMRFIESNPTVNKDMLDDAVAKKQITPETRDLVMANRADKPPGDPIPMHEIGSQIYDSETKINRGKAADNIMLPGWKTKFLLASEKEDTLTRQAHIDTVLAHQQVQEKRAKGLQNFTVLMDNATTVEQVDTAIAMMKADPMFHSSEKSKLETDALSRRDRLEGDLAMRAGVAGYPKMKQLIAQLEDPEAAGKFKHLTEDQRVAFDGKLRAKVHAIDSDMAHKEHQRKEWETTLDNTVIGHIVSRIAAGDIPDEADVVQKIREPNLGPVGTKPEERDPLKWGFSASGGRGDHALNIIRAARNAEREKRAVSDPEKVIALQNYFTQNPDEYSKAVLTGKPIHVVNSEGVEYDIDMGKDLSPGDMNHALQRADGWNGPNHQRTLEEQVAEQRRMMRADAIIRDKFGDDPFNKDNAGWLAKLRISMLDAEVAAQKGRPHKLTTDEMTIAMGNEADIIKANPDPQKFWWADKKNVGVATNQGNITLELTDRAGISSAARKTGSTDIVRMTPEGFKATAQNYYNNYDKPITGTWAKWNNNQMPNAEEKWTVYFKLRKLDLKDEDDIANAINRLVIEQRRAQTAKSRGGLNGR